MLVSYRELGLDVDELEEVARPWTERPDIPIGEGGRNIITWGKHKGNYSTWFDSRGEQFQRNVVGPKRYELIKAGKVKFDDLVDPQTGRLIPWKELKGASGVKGFGSGVVSGGSTSMPTFSPFVPAKTVKEAEEWVRNNILEQPFAEKKFIDRVSGKVVKVEQISNVSFRGLQIESANEISSALYEAKKRGLPLPRTVKAASYKGGFDMRTNGHTLEINTKTCKSAAAFKESTILAEKSRQDLVDALPILRRAKAEGKMTKYFEAQLSQAEDLMRFNRMGVSENIYESVMHELGHMLDARGNNIKGIEWEVWREKTASVKQSIINSDKYFNLSAYPRTTRMYGHEPAEIFAEAFTAYVRGERLETLPQNVIDFFKEYWK